MCSLLSMGSKWMYTVHWTGYVSMKEHYRSPCWSDEGGCWPSWALRVLPNECERCQSGCSAPHPGPVSLSLNKQKNKKNITSLTCTWTDLQGHLKTVINIQTSETVFYEEDINLLELTVKLFIQSLDLPLRLEYVGGVFVVISVRLSRTIHSDACKKTAGELNRYFWGKKAHRFKAWIGRELVCIPSS